MMPILGYLSRLPNPNPSSIRESLIPIPILNPEITADNSSITTLVYITNSVAIILNRFDLSVRIISAAVSSSEKSASSNAWHLKSRDCEYFVFDLSSNLRWIRWVFTLHSSPVSSLAFATSPSAYLDFNLAYISDH